MISFDEDAKRQRRTSTKTGFFPFRISPKLNRMVSAVRVKGLQIHSCGIGAPRTRFRFHPSCTAYSDGRCQQTAETGLIKTYQGLRLSKGSELRIRAPSNFSVSVSFGEIEFPALRMRIRKCLALSANEPTTGSYFSAPKLCHPCPCRPQNNTLYLTFSGASLCNSDGRRVRY